MFRKDGAKKIVGNVEFKDVDSIEEAVAEGKITIGSDSYNLYFAKSQPNKEKVTISDKKLYIKGLPKDLEESELNEMLGKCKISTTSGDSYIVFAEFETAEEQQDALDKLDNMEIKGKKIRARKALEKVFPPKPRLRKEKGDGQ